jgi:hypothetical protein
MAWKTYNGFHHVPSRRVAEIIDRRKEGAFAASIGAALCSEE